MGRLFVAADLSAKIAVSCETVKRGAERWLAGDRSLSPSPSSQQVILEEQAAGEGPQAMALISYFWLRNKQSDPGLLPVQTLAWEWRVRKINVQLKPVYG